MCRGISLNTLRQKQKYTQTYHKEKKDGTLSRNSILRIHKSEDIISIII